MLSGAIPNHHLNDQQVLFSVGSKKLPEYSLPDETTKRMTDFVLLLLSIDSSDRPTAADAQTILLSKSPIPMRRNPTLFQKTIQLLRQLKMEADSIYGHTLIENETGLTLLHYVALEDRADVLQELLQQTCNLNVKANTGQKKGFTPLHCAAWFGRFHCMKLLIDAGADVNYVDDDSSTPLHVAAYRDNLDCLKELIANGADVNASDFWSTVLHSAANGGSVECLKELIACGADVIAIDKNGATVLHAAAFGGSVECLKELIAAGAKATQKNQQGETPLDIAKLNKQSACIEYLEGITK